LRFRFDRQAGRYRHKPEKIKLEAGNSKLRTEKEKKVQNYAEALKVLLESAEDAAIDAAVETATKEYKDENAFARAVHRAFSDALVEELPFPEMDNLTDRYVEKAWQAYRYEDVSFLQAAKRRSVSFEIDLNLVDENALRYLRSIDRHYFGSGNYLADHPTVGKKFIKWLREEYIAKGINIRTDEAAQHEFYKQFKGLVRETSWQKINQLVDTTMARIQNMGQTLKLYETGFERFRIVGPRGGPICEYCRAMVGRVFSVEKAATRLAKIVGKGFEKVDDLPGFLPNEYTVEEVEEMTDEELQEAGFESPPYHPECRHRKAAED